MVAYEDEIEQILKEITVSLKKNLPSTVTFNLGQYGITLKKKERVIAIQLFNTETSIIQNIFGSSKVPFLLTIEDRLTNKKFSKRFLIDDVEDWFEKKKDIFLSYILDFVRKVRFLD